MINIALLGRQSSLERFSLLAKILQDLSRGVTATPVEYRDDAAHKIEIELCKSYDGVICWVDPVSSNENGKEESRADCVGDGGGLDQMLRRVAAKGLHVSTHPDIIHKMGTKKVLFDTRSEEWGLPNTHYHETGQNLREKLRTSLLSDKCRIIKMARGSSGQGVWRCDLIDRNKENGESDDLLLRIQHAGDDSIQNMVSLHDMVNRLEERMNTTGGGIIDMPFLPLVNEGIIRLYMFRDRCGGILHQLPLSTGHDADKSQSTSYPNLNVSKSKRYQTQGLEEGKRVHPPNSPAYRSLVQTLENCWIPKLIERVALRPDATSTPRDVLPVIWDIDFIHRSSDSLKNVGQDTEDETHFTRSKYVLCEINCSCVFPSEFMREMAIEIVDWVSMW